MYTMEQKIGGRFSETYINLLKIANSNVQQKAQEKVWTMVQMDQWHMEAHKMDMMRSFTK